MAANVKKIPGGAFQVARKLFDSELWLQKPPSWVVIWIYIIGKVRHESNNQFSRGENYFNFAKEHKNIGKYTSLDQIKKFLIWARQNSMVSTKRTTRGTVIRVLNYNTYQTFFNYKIDTKHETIANEAREKHERSTTINKNDKNDKEEKSIYSLSDGIIFWNNQKDLVLPKMVECISETDNLRKWWNKRKPNQKEWDMAVKNYIAEIKGRNNKSDYFPHRWSMAMFLTRERGYIEFVERNDAESMVNLYKAALAKNDNDPDKADFTFTRLYREQKGWTAMELVKDKDKQVEIEDALAKEKESLGIKHIKRIIK